MTSQQPVAVLVSGQASTSHAPELADVHLTISHQGLPEAREATTEQVRATQASLSSLLTSLSKKATGAAGVVAESAPVSRWSTGVLSSSNVSEWDNEARKTRIVGFRVSIRLEARFVRSAFSGDATDNNKGWIKLAEFVKTLAATPDVELDNIDWVLTDASALHLTREVQVQAVVDAQQKARNYASALGLQQLQATEIVDGSYRGVAGGSGAPGGPGAPYMASRAMLRSTGPGGEESLFAFEPKDVEVTANVNARFVAV